MHYIIQNRSAANSLYKNQATELIVQPLELLSAETPFLVPAYSLFSLLWVYEGTGHITIDGEQFDISTNVVFVVRPDQRINALILCPAKGVLISFSKAFLERFETPGRMGQLAQINHSGFSPAVHIKQEMNSLLIRIVHNMYYEYSQAYEFRAEVLYHFLKTFIISLGRQFEFTTQPVYPLLQPSLTTTFFRLLDEHYIHKKRVRDYACLLAITPNYLNQILKDLSGYTASYHIQRRIVAEAKRRILTEGSSLKEISYHLGFCDPSHFSKFFKNIAGSNFKDYKRTGLTYC